MSNSSASDLARRSCTPCPSGAKPLSVAEVTPILADLPGWKFEGSRITREYSFSSYLSGISWVAVMAEIADREDHHPDINISWCRVKVSLWTHTVNGLSMNDLILAAKLEEAWKKIQSQRG